MSQDIQIQLFENAKVRYLWDEEKQQYFFSVVDVIQVLTDSSNPQTYWRVLKKRLSDEGNETVTNCNALKMPAPNLATDAPNLATETQNLATENKPIIDKLVAKKVKAKMTSQQLIDCIVEVCIVEHSVEELSNLLHKSAAYLRNEVIPNLVDEEILIPTKPRHTRGQTYITSPKYRKQ